MALLADLRERNLRTDRTTLIVLDGAKALAKAVRELFGARGLIQRCQCHKMRNVLDRGMPTTRAPPSRSPSGASTRSGRKPAVSARAVARTQAGR